MRAGPRGLTPWVLGLGLACLVGMPASFQSAGAQNAEARIGEVRDALLPYAVVGDAVPRPLGGLVGDPARGEAIVRDRRRGNCLICHQLELEGERFQGDVAVPLDGVGARLGPGQIRLRLIDQSRIDPETLMPPYYRVRGLTDVDPRYAGKPVLGAQEIEDVVAYLSSLKE